MQIVVYVQPGAKKTEMAGEFDGMPKLRISAPPVEGAANKEIVKFVAKKLGVAKSAVRIVSGEKSRTKTLEIDAEMTEAAVIDLLSS